MMNVPAFLSEKGMNLEKYKRYQAERKELLKGKRSFRVNIRHNGTGHIATLKLPGIRQKGVSVDYGMYKDEILELYREAVRTLTFRMKGEPSRKELDRIVDYVEMRLKEEHPEAEKMFPDPVVPKKIPKELADLIGDELPESGLRQNVRVNVLRCYHLFYARYMTMKDKALLYRWNYFVTFTYDDAKCASAEEFYKKLKQCLWHLHDRKGWCYMLSPEKGALGERFHVHAVIYIPKDGMQGDLYTYAEWSTKRKKYEYKTGNTFFDKFGKNVFEKVDQLKLRSGGFRYLTKYISKSGEKLSYSRGTPADVELDITEEDIQVNPFDGSFASYYRYGTVLLLRPGVFMDPFTASLFEGESCEDTYEYPIMSEEAG